jgi:predicted nucleotidyltransferase
VTPLQRLAQRLGHSWSHLERAENSTLEKRAELTELLRHEVPIDTSLVVFGSLARGEYTRGSDLDWTLLVDGQADDGHYDRVRAITDAIDRGSFGKPGPTGVFGNFAFSHPILHQIGGQDDTNKNTTQRILLLLESVAIGRDDAHERVLRLVLSRYVEDDRGLLFSKSQLQRIPRFLLNDIVRYWRTLTVDFVSKQRERALGWALRNAKLRMSRKLIFVSGLLTCFAPVIFAEEGRSWTVDGAVSIPLIVDFLRERIRLTPLQQLAEAALRPAIQPATAKALFDEYDAFLGMLADDEKRAHLKALTMDKLGDDEVFRDVTRIGRRFQAALDQMFFKEDAQLTQLIQTYGVF